ncbi:Pyridoxal phosphate homeostasis protein [Anatilimnocola aggregata]|uniref:Pyridoxal phosphate homeostasis protein n=1 Tax=Anatilimnocola aggregata TaxID=2528021 RepID=A0A517YM12_9BACT|nr:YggS family pyridoxal phosphate-dependent enzyme [Anatilimnocola aggregata]QDU31260.1 Pyridoxal phosphate homeostasis protein [Anatilimnocola aggregata]
MPSFAANPLLLENIARVRAEVAEAAVRSGRRADEVTIVAATKYVDANITRQVAAAGLLDLGESRPQEIWSKGPELTDLPIRWHLIGHLQRNKVRRTLPFVALFHSIDSLRLLEELQTEAEKLGQVVAILLEVNISGDEAKHGFAPAEMPSVIETAAQFSHLQIRGLMSMAGLDTDAVTAQQQFAAVRQLRDQLAPNAPANVSLADLSMGMSGDFREAIAEGATMVRIGSSFFEGLF